MPIPRPEWIRQAQLLHEAFFEQHGVYNGTGEHGYREFCCKYCRDPTKCFSTLNGRDEFEAHLLMAHPEHMNEVEDQAEDEQEEGEEEEEEEEEVEQVDEMEQEMEQVEEGDQQHHYMMFGHHDALLGRRGATVRLQEERQQQRILDQQQQQQQFVENMHSQRYERQLALRQQHYEDMLRLQESYLDEQLKLQTEHNRKQLKQKQRAVDLSVILLSVAIFWIVFCSGYETVKGLIQDIAQWQFQGSFFQ